MVYEARPLVMPRSEPASVLDGPVAVAQAAQIVLRRSVTTADGSVLTLAARSLCLHSDTPGAAKLARSVRSALLRAGAEISAFT